MNQYDTRIHHGNNFINNYQNYVNGNNRQQMGMGNKKEYHDRMLKMQQQINKIKNLQQMCQQNNFKDLKKMFDDKSLTNAIIKPIQLEKPSLEKVSNDYIIASTKLVPERENLWKNRTNIGYKNIFKNTDYGKYTGVLQNIDSTKIPLHGADPKKDLIVYNTTELDKDTVSFTNELDEMIKFLEKHNDELSVIYSSSKMCENKAKFEYHNATKFLIKYDPGDFKKLKKDRIKYFQQEQKKLEADKKKVDDMIESAIINGTLSKEEIKELETCDNDDDTQNIDYNELHKELRAELGDDYDPKLVQQIIDSRNKNNKIQTSKNIKNTKNYDTDSDSDSDSNSDQNSDSDSESDDSDSNSDSQTNKNYKNNDKNKNKNITNKKIIINKPKTKDETDVKILKIMPIKLNKNKNNPTTEQDNKDEQGCQNNIKDGKTNNLMEKYKARQKRV